MPRSDARPIPAPLVFLVSLALLSAPGVAAQVSGSLQGTVVDEVDGTPLDGAEVTLVEVEAEARSDRTGRFEFSSIPTGTVTLRVAKPGYGSVVELVEITPAGPLPLEIQLPRMETMLRELLVQGRSRGAQEYLVEGDDRHETAADLLANSIPGVRVNRGSGGVGTGAEIRIRGIKTLQGINEPLIFVDGIRIDSRARLAPTGHSNVLSYLETIPASQVDRIRVLSGPAAASRFQDAANGVILVETVRGGASDRGRQEDDEGDDG